MPPADSKCAEESVVADSEHYMSVSVATEHRLEADGEAVHDVQLVCQMSDDDVKTFNFYLVLTERNSLFWLFQPSAIWQTPIRLHDKGSDSHIYGIVHRCHQQ